MRIIGLHGKARSGKDQFASILCKTYGFTQVSFAQKIKEFGVKYFDTPLNEFNENKTPRSRRILQGIGSSVRKLTSNVYGIEEVLGLSGHPTWIEDIAANEFGIERADFKRRLKYNKIVFGGLSQLLSEDNIREFVSVSKGSLKNIWIDYLKQEMIEDKVYLISDVRYLNEKEAVKGNGRGRVAKIIRMDRPKIEAGAHHLSEVELDQVIGWDFIIGNEQKADWQERLVLSGANMVKKFKSEGFFTENDIKKFMINLNEH